MGDIVAKQNQDVGPDFLNGICRSLNLACLLNSCLQLVADTYLLNRKSFLRREGGCFSTASKPPFEQNKIGARGKLVGYGKVLCKSAGNNFRTVVLIVRVEGRGSLSGSTSPAEALSFTTLGFWLDNAEDVKSLSRKMKTSAEAKGRKTCQQRSRAEGPQKLVGGSCSVPSNL